MEIIKPALEGLTPRERHLIDDRIDLAREHLLTDEVMHGVLRKLEDGPGRTEKHQLTNEQKIMLAARVAVKSPCYLCGESVVFGAQSIRLVPYRRHWWGDAAPEMAWTREADEPCVFFFSLCQECVLEEGWLNVARNKAIDEANRGVLKLLR